LSIEKQKKQKIRGKKHFLENYDIQEPFTGSKVR